jgi:hypothetical protein
MSFSDVEVQNSVRRQTMKKLLAGLCGFALLSLISPLSPAQVQTRTVETRPAGPFGYDITKEVTLHGTVSSVLTKSSRGMIMGSHLLLATSSGAVDASLGRFALRGNSALSVAAGEQVEVTGVMETIRDKQVFIARIVKAGGQTYTIRNEHGAVASPQARERASQKATQKGESL